ncbi:hypothetical protein KIW84_075374 [Lathyrus oleraceus]|uniref:Retroviral polymerase SH3-like domain-containing protein n=1 Tax=Pisum sativum TaxID=3888 RepID=A0A9D5A0Z4_PEA|nr:hypothetical protein KIW84_075374 [Pisum sativum]
MTKSPFTGKGERANDLLALIHTDVCGPLNIPARGGFQYFITFTGDFSRYGYVYLMKHKSESFEKFKEFKNEVQNQLAYTLNRVPSKKVEKTPYEVWSGKKPHMSYMKIWGCEVYVKRQILIKLELKSDKCLFVGYPKETIGYYFYNPSEGKVFVARTGVFLEKDFISKGINGRKVELEEIQESQSIDTPMGELEQETQVVLEEQPA